MKIRVDLTAIVASIIVLYCNGGMMGFVKGSSIVTLGVYAAVLLWFAMIISREPTFVWKYTSVCFYVILFFLLVNALGLVAAPDITSVIERMSKNVLFLLVFVAMFIYYSEPQRNWGRRAILFVWGVDVVIASMYTLYRLIQMPTLSRILATESPEKILGSGVSIAGILGYGSIYGLVFVITAIMLFVRKAGPVHKGVMIACAVLFAYTVIRAQFFIAVILCVLGILMGLFLNEKINLKKILIVMLCLPAIMLAGYLIVSRWLPSLVKSGFLPVFVSERLNMFLQGISFEQLLDTTRGEVYLQSLNTIRDTYGLGKVFIDARNTGGHSEIFDLFAIYGIPVGGVLLYGLWKVKTFICRTIPSVMVRNYNIIWFLFFIMSSFNTSLWCQTTISIFLIVPLAYLQFQPEEVN